MPAYRSATARARWAISGDSTGSGDTTFSRNANLPWWPVQLYLIGSGDAGPAIIDTAGATGNTNGVFVTGGGALAIGGNYAICRSRQVGIEAGYRHQVLNVNDTLTQTGSVFLTISANVAPITGSFA